MPKKKQDSQQNSASGDFKSKQMILSVEPDKHAWLQKVANDAHTSMPKIVSLILGEASKHEPTAYINQIKKLNAKEALIKLDAESERIEAERKRLAELLED